MDPNNDTPTPKMPDLEVDESIYTEKNSELASASDQLASISDELNSYKPEAGPAMEKTEPMQATDEVKAEPQFEEPVVEPAAEPTTEPVMGSAAEPAAKFESKEEVEKPKAMFMPAEPVPGSIGSAKSYEDKVETPESDKTVEPMMPNQVEEPVQEKPTEEIIESQPTNLGAINDLPQEEVSFTEKAGKSVVQPKKKKSKLVIVLAVVLVLLLIGGAVAAFFILNKDNSSKSNMETKPAVSETQKKEKKPVAKQSLVCVAEVSKSEMALLGKPVEASKQMELSFKDGKLTSITEEMMMKYSDEEAAKSGKEVVSKQYEDLLEILNKTSDPFKSSYELNGTQLVSKHSATLVELLDSSNAAQYFDLPVNQTGDGEEKLSMIKFDELKKNLSSKRFNCK